jgi:hypothetical protein
MGMQVISVERWTFWAAVVVAVLAGPLSTGFGGVWNSCGSGCVSGIDLGVSLTFVVFILLLFSVVMGGSRDPSVRSLSDRERA